MEIAEEMEELARALLPLASPIMDRVHQRFLTHFVEQDIIGHMEADLDGAPLDLGRLRVAIAFADLAGYTRLTEEAGEEEAVDAVERFIEDVEVTLPEGARVIKTIGDEVMIVGSDAAALVDWAVGFQRLVADRRPLPRIGMHYGPTLLPRRRLLRARGQPGRAGGARGRRAGRCSSRAPWSSSPGATSSSSAIGEVRLKGFAEATELFVARGLRATMADELLDARARRTGLLRREPAVVVLLSGGRDSVCLLDVAVELGCAARALHVNYGLRAEADDDEAHCRALCERPRGRARGAPRDAARGRPRQPAGVGARRALRRRGHRGRRRARGGRPHGLRPGRDRALPAGRVARAPRAARDAAALGPPRPPAARR